MLANIRIGNRNYGGQDSEAGITFEVKGDAVVGDIVGPVNYVGAAVERCRDGFEPSGMLVTLERDKLGTVYDFGTVTVARLTDTVRLGVTKVVGDGLGGVRCVDPSSPTGLGVVVIGTQTVDGQSYVAFYRH